MSLRREQKVSNSETQNLPENLNPESWMVKGTYATYEGNVNGTASTNNITGKMQVNDLNSTHVLIKTDMKISTNFAPPIGDRTFVWINRTNIDFGPKGEKLVEKRETQITIEGLGERNCVAYDYTNEDINCTYYLEKIIQWPLRITYTTVFEDQTYMIQMNLKDSNISQLR